MPMLEGIRKVMMIGSGPIVIGQAAEFDYAGTQACRVLKDAGLNVVLVNSNPATIMTDRNLADETYLEPLTVETIRRIIEKERPDGLLAGFGGQTGLTVSSQLAREGFLEKMGVRLLGTPAEAIDRAEDRELFKETMEKIGQPLIPSATATDLAQSLEIAEEIGYPVIVRPAFTLGGGGGGVANDARELREVATIGLEASPIHQILVEKYIYGWKEIEFEVMRDGAGNAIAVCSMENFDPVGVHTGDSIVVAPALTLSNREYQMLRTAALNIIEALGVVGGCNCQFALDPQSFQYAVIEVNPRVSRSSALASKATGYPIAKVAAKIALGYTLDEIPNDVTGKTCACFEPAVDYVVVKLPRWPFDKFAHASRKLGTQMKATGEVMSIAPSFEMALMKAVRGAEIGQDTLRLHQEGDVLERLRAMDDRRLFTVFEAIRKGISLDEIFAITRIDRFFLSKLRNLAEYEDSLAGGLTEELYRKGKSLGYTDAALKRLSGCETPAFSGYSYKMVDTCAAEFDAKTPYFYATYAEECESRRFPRSGKPTILVLGSGPIRIGQGIEFDYSSVHCVKTLRNLGYEVAIVNNNPETVSTDYDTADRLYFEPLTEEDVLSVIRVENPVGVVVAFGGQTAVKLAKGLDRHGIKILGTSAEGIDLAEDRERFDAMLETLGIRRPAGMGVLTEEDAVQAAERLGYPVLVRPSYVIGGQNMTIAYTEAEVRRYMATILSGGIENPVLVDKYMPGTELEVDVISDGEDVLIPGIMEHIERAGVHSGDSIAVYPPYNLTDGMRAQLVQCSQKLALALGTKGLVNIQYLIYRGELYVIEVNPRASRTIPYISKVTGVPMVDLASRVMLGQKLRDLGFGSGLYRTPPYYAVKVPVFSFEKLNDVNSYLGPEMKSTGEVLGVGKNLTEALFKGLRAAGIRVPDAGKPLGVLLSVDDHDHDDLVNLAKKLYDLGAKMYATRTTAHTIRQLGIDVEEIPGIGESEDAFHLMQSGKVSYVVYTGAIYDRTIEDYIALSRRALALSIACLTSLDTANALADILKSRFNEKNTELVDINHMRTQREHLRFSKMQASGTDYIVVDNRPGQVSCAESLCVSLCDRHFGVGGDGIALIEPSDIADARMRMFNSDGSEGGMAGGCLMLVGKYLHDRGIAQGESLLVEAGGACKRVDLFLSDGKVTSARVDMGCPQFSPEAVPVLLSGESVIDRPVEIRGEEYRITCLSMGNPHCVVFLDRVDALDLAKIGPRFETAPLFPERVNTEFVRVVNERTLKMRVWERGNGETLACGTGACAAVVAAVKNGFCPEGVDITVKLPGGDLTVQYRDGHVYLMGSTALVFEGEIEY
ncbi:MAG TPA: carbamoyl-phosphate synthase large subunit [Candidatus Pullichristensenella excrementigallinarum]|uniref:Multifunctional fusion protein n=1 Tax=Candidatus Pullichristensenella excrementigallinarum TaxID=2840907 RepID=A0A9D1ID93_9FIRM|nr:carbamoyl-phosphate synthase large subunit [Candidatus Pullichristensenella excrementigallinarum]